MWYNTTSDGKYKEVEKIKREMSWIAEKGLGLSGCGIFVVAIGKALYLLGENGKRGRG